MLVLDFDRVVDLVVILEVNLVPVLALDFCVSLQFADERRRVESIGVNDENLSLNFGSNEFMVDQRKHKNLV